MARLRLDRSTMRLRALLEEHGAAGTTADAVYQALRRGILQGHLEPRERLRSDALANELCVSRTPVREALRKLEAEGLVARSGSGLTVHALSGRGALFDRDEHRPLFHFDEDDGAHGGGGGEKRSS